MVNVDLVLCKLENPPKPFQLIERAFENLPRKQIMKLRALATIVIIPKDTLEHTYKCGNNDSYNHDVKIGIITCWMCGQRYKLAK